MEVLVVEAEEVAAVEEVSVVEVRLNVQFYFNRVIHGLMKYYVHTYIYVISGGFGGGRGRGGFGGGRGGGGFGGRGGGKCSLVFC